MDLITITLYGLVQGLSEFLPISSSGHLALLPKFLGIEDPGTIFDLWMHLGTALAVLTYFRKLIQKLLSDFFTTVGQTSFFQLLSSQTKCTSTSPEKYQRAYFTINLLFSTFCTFVLVLLLKTWAMEYGRNIHWVAFNLIFFGLVMYGADKWGPHLSPLGDYMANRLRLKEAAIIGLCQALAIFPGVSRSGITLTASRFIGMGRREAGAFSFLLSLPIILGGVVLEVPPFLKSNIDASHWPYWLWGVVVSFLTGIFTIHFFLKLLEKMGLGVFTLYRVILGVYLLLSFR